MRKTVTFPRNGFRMAFVCLYILLIIISIQMLITVLKYTLSDPRAIVEKETIQEYNYLKSLLDLPNTKEKATTDGLSNFQTSEWPVMTLSLFCYGARNLAQFRPDLKPEIVSYMRKAIERVMTPQYHHFIINHYGNPFDEEHIEDNAFYLGHVIMMLASYREVADDDYFDAYFHKFAKGFYGNYKDTQTMCLESYSGLTWTSEQAVPLRALYIHDKIFKSGYSSVVYDWQDTMLDKYMGNGLLITVLDNETGEIFQGPRAIPNTWTILFLHDVLPEFCRKLYLNAKKHFLIHRLGFPMFKEFLGKEQKSTGDTGPIILGAAAPPTAFAMGCAALYGDSEYFVQSSLLADCLGVPLSYSGKKRFLIGGAIGTAAIFMLRSMMLNTPYELNRISITQSLTAIAVILLVTLFCIYRTYRLLNKGRFLL